MAGSESQSVGRALSSPWSPRAVHALCSLLTRVIKLSMAAAQGGRDLSGSSNAAGEGRDRDAEQEEGRRGGETR